MPDRLRCRADCRLAGVAPEPGLRCDDNVERVIRLPTLTMPVDRSPPPPDSASLRAFAFAN
jgi:hypothetical protein